MTRWVIALAALAAGCTESALVLGPEDGGIVASDDGGSPVLDGGEPDGGEPWHDAGPSDGAEDVSAGGAHACAVISGALACWGDGSEGALGIGPTGDRLEALRVGSERDWLSIAASDSSTCGLRVGQGLWCWGANEVGQLGLGDRSPRRGPTAVALPGVPTALSATRRTACAILDDGRLLCWGQNFEGQLGRADPYPGEDGLSPAPVASASRFREVSAGQGHTCAIATDGGLWCWGRNTSGELGLGPGAPIQVRTPTRVGSDTDWARVACGQGHTCGVREDGTLWCWGDDFAGQVGIALGTRFLEPTRVGSDVGWASVSTYVFQTCGVRTDGTLWCWGRNVEGQLGTGDTRDRGEPTRVDDRDDWARVSAGWFHTCAQRRDGSVWCTGENGDGRIGVGDGERRDVFSRVVGVGVE